MRSNEVGAGDVDADGEAKFPLKCFAGMRGLTR